MWAELEFPIKATREQIQSALAHATHSLSNPSARFTVEDGRVEQSHFGSDRAFIIRGKVGNREGEIGKIVVEAMKDGWVLLSIPENRTGGPPDLDADGVVFWQVFRALWRRLHELRFITLEEAKELPIRLKDHQWNEYV